MKIFVIIIIVVILIHSFRAFANNWKLETDGGFVTVENISKLAQALKETGEDGSFWVILVPGTSKSDGFDANLQFSLQKGSLGIDWVLLAKRNIQDSKKFIKIAESHNLSISKIEENGVEYLRAEGPVNLSDVATNILNEMYGIDSTIEMPLIITGFEWK